MRDKLIDIILASKGLRDTITVANYEALYAAEIAARKAQAGKIADALIAAGVMLVEPVTFSVGHPDPVGEKGEPGPVGIPAGEWVSVKDALPEEGKMCCVLTEQGVQYAAYYGEYGWEASERGYSFYVDDVKWWCDFPELPKEE